LMSPCGGERCHIQVRADGRIMMLTIFPFVTRSAGRILEQMLSSSKHFKEEFAKESKVLVRTLENLAKDMLQEDVKR
jgi:hypothetical protein